MKEKEEKEQGKRREKKLLNRIIHVKYSAERLAHSKCKAERGEML